jgi:hypothetical protein
MKTKLIVCDKRGWPVEKIRGRPITNALRCLIHGSRVNRWLVDGNGGLIGRCSRELARVLNNGPTSTL